MSTKEEIREPRISKLTGVIKTYLETSQSYHFRPVKIDGVYCYPIIHKSPQIVNIEAMNIYIEKKNQSHEYSREKYSLYHTSYKTIEQAVQIVEKIVATYKIYGGDLCPPTVYEMLKLEETVLPYSEEQKCCVCFENTTDVTVCHHYICLACRDMCILKEKTDCPMCRKQNIMCIYKSENGLINNNEYPELKQAYNLERMRENINFPREPSDDEMSDLEEDDEEEGEEDDDLMEITYIIDRTGNRGLNHINMDMSSLAISETFSIFDENNDPQNFNFEAIYHSLNHNE